MKQVVAAILVRKKRIFIAQRAAGDPLEGWWEFPGGKIEPGESPEQALAREMQEEFLVDVQVGTFFANSHYDYGTGSIQINAYWVNGSTELVPQVHELTAWVPAAELLTHKLLPADIPIAEALQRHFEVTG